MAGPDSFVKLDLAKPGQVPVNHDIAFERTRFLSGAHIQITVQKLIDDLRTLSNGIVKMDGRIEATGVNLLPIKKHT